MPSKAGPFREFHVPEDVRQWVSLHYSAEQLAIVTVGIGVDSPLADYKGGFFRIMNEYLRAGATKSEDYDIVGLQTMLLGCNLPDDIVVYRYVSLKEWLTIRFCTLRGATYTCPTFFSTTLLKKYYSMLDIKYGRLPIKILAPRGTPGTYLSEVNLEMAEYEILFAHHCSLKRNGFMSYIMI